MAQDVILLLLLAGLCLGDWCLDEEDLGGGFGGLEVIAGALVFLSLLVLSSFREASKRLDTSWRSRSVSSKVAAIKEESLLF